MEELRIFEVLSEEMEEIVWEDFSTYCGHYENYRIYEIVEAKSHGQAKWMAWKRDDSFTGDVKDMPKFSVKLYRGEHNETY